MSDVAEEHEIAYRWTRIDWEKQTRVFNLIIETHPWHRRLNYDIHAVHHMSVVPADNIDGFLLFCVQCYDPIHETEIDTHTTKRSRKVGFQTGASGIRDCTALALHVYIGTKNILIGILYLWHVLASSETSSVDFGYATATGSCWMFMEDHSEYPCRCKSSSSVEIASSPSTSLNSRIACLRD
jgi:hypothetical protein